VPRDGIAPEGERHDRRRPEAWCRSLSRALAALIAWLAKQLGVARRDVTVVQGQTGALERAGAARPRATAPGPCAAFGPMTRPRSPRADYERVFLSRSESVEIGTRFSFAIARSDGVFPSVRVSAIRTASSSLRSASVTHFELLRRDWTRQSS
jgi:hypothetical protein